MEQQMDLTLPINETTAKKIQALSILADCNANDISSLIEANIDKIISEEILKYIIDDIDPVDRSEASESILEDRPNVLTPEGLVEPYEPSQEALTEDENEFGVADSIGQRYDEVEEEALPEELQQELKDMVTKNKDGEETGYTDEIMADAQAMAEGDFAGQEDVIAAAAGSIGAESKAGRYSDDDSPREEGGIPSNTPDVLPVDLGIDKASSDEGGMAFFGQVVEGQKGNKERRNKVTRKRRKG